VKAELGMILHYERELLVDIFERQDEHPMARMERCKSLTSSGGRSRRHVTLDKS
jgi:hypothetical protein